MTTWIPAVVIAGTSSLGAVDAAEVTAQSAMRSKHAELQAARILDLEKWLP
jgi:hypothetical protein